MRIACPNCALAYTLDERLLPPGGAPVQCTSCNHIFTAAPATTAVSDPSASQASPPRQTAAQTPVASTHVTQVFGRGQAAATESQTPVASTRVTQVFGRGQVAATESPAPVASAHVTQVFGRGQVAATESPAPVASTHVTQVFGRGQVTAAEPPAPVASAHVTQVFGRGQGAAADAQVRTTQAFGLPAVKRSAPHTTQAFGAAPSAALDGSGAARKTPAFGTPETPGPVAEPSIRATRAYGLPAVKPAAAVESVPPQSAATGVPAASLTTSFDEEALSAARVSVGGDPAVGGALHGAEIAPHVTQIYGKATKPASPLELFTPTGILERSAPEPERLTFLEGPVTPRAAPAKRRRWPAIIIGLAAAGAIAFFGVKLFNRLHAIPAAVIAEEQSLIGQDRLDDAAGRAETLAKLDRIIARAPTFVDAQADRALLLALALDDAQAPLSVFASESAALDQDISALIDAKSTSDWEVRVNTLRDRKAQLARRSAQVELDVKGRKAALTQALATLPASTAEATSSNLAVVRARGVAAGVEGTGAALELAERYTTLGDPGSWATLILAEYALNAHAPPQTMEEVRGRLRILKARDASFLRPYMLLARMALAEDRPSAAVPELEAVVALNPHHALARELLDAVLRVDPGRATP